MKPGTKLPAIVVCGILALGFFAAGCGSDSDDASDSPAAAATEGSGSGGAGSGASSGGSSGGQQTGGPGEVSRQEAGRIAVAYMEDRYGQPGRVTYRGPEDDAGARWEIEVTLDGGREFDVLVSASGDVIGVK